MESRLKYRVLVPQRWEEFVDNDYPELMDIISEKIREQQTIEGKTEGVKIYIDRVAGTLVINNFYEFWWFRGDDEAGDFPPYFSLGISPATIDGVTPEKEERSIVGIIYYRECVPSEFFGHFPNDLQRVVREITEQIQKYSVVHGKPEGTPMNLGGCETRLIINHDEKFWWHKPIRSLEVRPRSGNDRLLTFTAVRQQLQPQQQLQRPQKQLQQPQQHPVPLHLQQQIARFLNRQLHRPRPYHR